MEKPFILHMLTPMAHMSPFDVNMACDAGYNIVVPYTNVTLEQVAGLTQDAIFSRGPKGVKRTGIFIGGRDNLLASDMLEAARKAMVPPFEACVFADPSGAFTTAGAMAACVERQLKKAHQTTLAGKTVAVFGGTGPVGAAVAVLAAQAGASAALVARDDKNRTQRAAETLSQRYGVPIGVLDATNPWARLAAMNTIDIALATARAGVQVLSQEDLRAAGRLLVVADANAVPPGGVRGVGLMDDGNSLEAASGQAVSIGALSIGQIKYQTERGLFESMLQGEKARYLDMRDAFFEARKHAGLA
ncbi:MAG: NAD(P)-dependent methylenetetrahydromethanopterin dehydrogenase [Burkholderiales bacterium]